MKQMAYSPIILNYKSLSYTPEYYQSLLNHIMTAREAEEREAILFRQGAGIFHLPGAGHESIALLAPYIKQGDKIFPHYRDKALMLALGVPLYQLALDYFGKAESSSGGTQMASHFYAPEVGVMPCATPTALQALPAAGAAWGMKLKGDASIAVCSTGEASIRQGEWFEALAFTIQHDLPLVLIVEDNGYGISTATASMMDPVRAMLPKERLHRVKSNDIVALDECFAHATIKARNGSGVQIIWMECPRLMSHTSSDDQRIYRDKKELESLAQQDILIALKNYIATYDIAYYNELPLRQDDIKEEVRETYLQASQAEFADAHTIASHTIGKTYTVKSFSLSDKEEWHMVKAVNHTLHHLMHQNNNIILFGEDIEDPKGGVFGLTKHLSTEFPERVFNSPLAEATIAGVASGLTMQGFLPIIELQFIDFSTPAINQIMNQIATMRWRTAGKQKCPVIMLAPCGGYISGGGAWHSQTQESLFSQMSGLRVVMPANPQDAANAIIHAAQGEDPVLILLPKKQFFRAQPIRKQEEFYDSDIALIQEGVNVTVVAWGNGIELCEDAIKELAKENISCDLLCLRTLSPLNLSSLKESVKKTGRLVVVQETTKHCSLGQAIISQLVTDTEIWDSLYAPPQLVTRDDTYVPFDYKSSLSILPSIEDICNNIRLALSL